MSETISSLSIIIAVQTFIWSLWYADLEQAAKKEIKKYKADNKLTRKYVWSIFFSKQLPLLIINLFGFLIILPISFNTVITSLQAYRSLSYTYSPQNAIIIFIAILFLYFFIIQLLSAIKLLIKISMLSKGE